MTDKQPDQDYQYLPRLSRRESLKWMGILAASAALPGLAACSDNTAVAATQAGHWPELSLAPVTAKGYGKDPNLIIPPETPWPRTLTPAQLTTVAVLSDILVPKDGNVPSASQVNVPDVVDEWVSAPYASQQRDRITILSALAWIDDEAELRFQKPFTKLSSAQQTAIIDDIAYENAKTPEQFQRIATAFSRFRSLVLAAFFCSPEGTKDIGYLGNVAIAGDYPGPTEEAKQHLDKMLQELGLSDYAYQEQRA
ncbi:gluconate 2-dehydrogenase subunit 3 family protein [Alteromonas pelagimontana]|uniref:Gluconate 2-dehydrogenase subunit 3 family protein n=1 Tax=Alteromonas pelagimontana TaxID=1858656 RepID=A0A6M4MC87_9ALTE|nr:gluconate 2-dehydrogenase subunit 3 family protein [Alteromonas pelagimontana]QJR80165.1 gluconate 2-dehydrogenase subunit 3 family protein [Alteromonas pelagimontana]